MWYKGDDGSGDVGRDVGQKGWAEGRYMGWWRRVADEDGS